jgi:hypothetical protein
MTRKVICIVVAVIFSPIAVHFSTVVVMSQDSSQEDTVGIISREGFPIWFVETAPGYSVVDGLHQNRLFANLLVWAAVLILVALAVNRFVGRRAVGKA